jgi:outer membrane protein TolC
LERWSVAQCVEAALRLNGDVRGAQARTTQARGGALGAWANVLPTLSAEAGYNRTIPDERSAQVFVPDPADPTMFNDGFVSRSDRKSLSANLSANLINLPAWSQKRRQEHLRSRAQESEAETRNDVVFRVKQQYFECVKAERLAEVAVDSERLARDEEARSEALFGVGSVARGDVLKARARRASTQLSRIQAQNQVEIQRQRLKKVIGLDGPAAVAVQPDMDGAVPLPDSAAVVGQALRARPTLASAAAAERAARSGLFSARMARAPRLTGSVNVDRSNFEDRIEFYDALDDLQDERHQTIWSGGLRLSIPIFDGLALEGDMRSAKGALVEAEAARRQLELDVVFEAKEAWLLLKEAVERIAVAQEGVASAEEDHKFSKSRYELGAGTYLDLLNAEVSLEEARQQLVEALADARVAEAALERAIGERRY